MKSQNLSRRHFAGLSLTAATMSSLLTSASGKETLSSPPALTEGGVYKVKLGEMEILSIQDGIIPMQKGFFLGEEAKIKALLEESGQSGDVIPAPISAFIIKTPQKTILIDSGMGIIDMMGPGFGNLANGLALAGISPADIHTVVLTHCHPDHIGGMMTSDGKKAFPEAEVVLAEAEAAFWTDEGIMNQAPENMKGLFQFVQNTLKTYGDQISRVSTGKEITSGVTLQTAPGHTPGHSIIDVSSGSEKITIVADLLHNADLFTAYPEIGFGFDVDKTQAAETRKKLFAQLASEKSLIMGSHLHFPGIGRILAHGSAYRYSPATLA